MVLAVMMLVACTSSAAPVARVSATAGPTTNPSAASGPTAVPSISPSSSPLPVASPPELGSSLSCRLPVTWAVQSGTTYAAKAGFVSFPGATLLEDASAPAGSVFFDRAYSRWLPVWRDNVSPDGKHYAYSEGNP